MSSRGLYLKPRVRLLWLIIAVVGISIWLALLLVGDSARGWRALLAAFAFFTPIAAAMVCWSAIFQLSETKWIWPWIGTAEAGLHFTWPSLIIIIALWLGQAQWAPWSGKVFHQGLWLNVHFILGRDLLALALFWMVAWRYVASRRRGGGQSGAVWLIIVYAWVFSLLAFDLVGALDPLWHSSLFGGYFFISGLYGAITLWTFLLIVRRRIPAEAMGDFAGLIVAFSLLTTAMLYSQLLPIWYANLPGEVRFLIPRWNLMPWAAVSLILLFTVYLGPLIFLLTRRSRRSRWYLALVTMVLLILSWLERLWLITPTFHPDRLDIGASELAIAGALTGIFGYIVSLLDRRATKTNQGEGLEL